MHDDDWNRFTTYVQAVDASYKSGNASAYEKMLEAFDFRGALTSLLDFVIHLARTLPVQQQEPDELREPCRVTTRIADGQYRLKDDSLTESGLSGLPCPVCYSVTMTNKFTLTIEPGVIQFRGECYSCKRKSILAEAVCTPNPPEPDTDDSLPALQSDELELPECSHEQPSQENTSDSGTEDAANS